MLTPVSGSRVLTFSFVSMVFPFPALLGLFPAFLRWWWLVIFPFPIPFHGLSPPQTLTRLGFSFADLCRVLFGMFGIMMAPEWEALQVFCGLWAHTKLVLPTSHASVSRAKKVGLNMVIGPRLSSTWTNPKCFSVYSLEWWLSTGSSVVTC